MSHRNISTMLDISTNYFVRYVYPRMSNGGEGTYKSHKEIRMLTIPFHHIYGFLLLNAALVNGTSGIIMKEFQATLLLETIQKRKPTVLCMMAPMLLFLQDRPAELYDLSSVEVVVIGGSPYVKNVLEAFLEKFKRVRYLIPIYGWPECGTAFMSPMTQRYGAATILPNFKQKLVCPKTGEAVGFGKEGEICLQSPTIMKGYLNNPEETAKAIDSEGWFHTGEIGILDHSGQTTVVEHVEELIRVDGKLVASSEIEDVLMSHEDVVDAGVVGVPDTQTGEKPRAYVVTRNARLSKSEVEKFVFGTVFSIYL
ncbi:AMP-binding enzyme [Trichostrongylus colubriformis]|uniref:AMP-binding enzyme n=1 Tax=Trichostrongylus colubriformis TaxID=6319 RepID=A0AAN8FIK6_TRICO